MIGSYLPPDLEGSLAGTTLYNYNFDKQLTQVLKIGALPINLNYDSVSGALTSIQSGEQNYQITYKPQTDLPHRIISPGKINLDFEYISSLVKSVKTSGEVNNLISFDYDVEGRLSQIGLQDAARATSAVGLKYDKDNLLIKAGDLSLVRNSSNSVSESQLGKVIEKLGYNKYGEMTSDSFLVDNKKIFSNSYQRDKLGRVIEIKERDEAIEYLYDQQGRLEKVKRRGKIVRTYSYDGNGNRLDKKEGKHHLKAKYDDQDRLLEYGNKNYEYNLTGDLVKIIEPKEGHKETFWERLVSCFLRFFKKDYHPDYQNVTRFSYDNFGSLTAVTLPDGKKIEYIIDGQSRRIGKKINGKLVQSFIYQSQTQIAAELNGEGQLVRRFVYGTKSNIPDYVIEKDKTYRIISNQVGTPIALVDVAQGKIEKIFSYDEFGISEVKNQSDNSFPFGFAGGLYDEDTRLVRFGARDYDPETGRWVTKDPIGFAGGDTNLYGYTFSDPVNFIDPSGHFGVAGATVGFISGAIGGYVTGGLWGGIVGSVVGAGVGAVNPWGAGAAGSFAGGVISSLAGQVIGNAVAQQPLLSIDPALAIASGFGGSTAALGTRAAAAAGFSNIAIESGIATIGDLLFNIPANSLTPGPYDFGKMCR